MDPAGPSEEPRGYIADSSLATPMPTPIEPIAPPAAPQALAAPAVAQAPAPRTQEAEEILLVPYQANSQRSEAMFNLLRTVVTTQVVCPCQAE